MSSEQLPDSSIPTSSHPHYGAWSPLASMGNGDGGPGIHGPPSNTSAAPVGQGWGSLFLWPRQQGATSPGRHFAGQHGAAQDGPACHEAQGVAPQHSEAEAEIPFSGFLTAVAAEPQAHQGQSQEGMPGERGGYASSAGERGSWERTNTGKEPPPETGTHATDSPKAARGTPAPIGMVASGSEASEGSHVAIEVRCQPLKGGHVADVLPIHVSNLTYSVHTNPLLAFLPARVATALAGPGPETTRSTSSASLCTDQLAPSPVTDTSMDTHSSDTPFPSAPPQGEPALGSSRGLSSPLSSSSKVLLRGVSFDVLPGQVLAIAGSSGAGKSTLLDAIAGRIKPSSLKGTAQIHGMPVGCPQLRRIIGYVTQDDSLFPVLTPRETLMLSARLRLPRSVPGKAKAQRVDQLLQELGLQAVADSRIGSVERRGLSGGERRRVSIGTDLVHDPPVLLLDEPTSGLDSHAALKVVEVLRRMAHQGRTVLLTIHQPSLRILEQVDQILLLSHGAVVHHGSLMGLERRLELQGLPVPLRMNGLEYAIELLKMRPDDMRALQEEREARRQYLSSPSASPDSMADVIGDVTLASPSISPPISPDFSYTPGAPQLGYASPPFADVRSEREGGLGVAEPVAGEHGKGLTAGLQGQAGREEGPGAGKGRGAAGKVEEVEGNGKDGRREPCFAVSCFDEVAALSGRNLKVMLRTKELCVGRVAQVAFCAICLGTLFLHAPNNARGVEGATLPDASASSVLWVFGVCSFLPAFSHRLFLGCQERMGFLAFSLAFLLTSSVEALPLFLQERQVFLRETSSGAYRVISYLVASVVVFAPFLLALAVVFSCASYWLVGMYSSWSAFLFFLLTMWIVLLTANSLVSFLAALAPDFITANSMIAGLMGAFFLFSGFFISRKYIPSYWTWMYYLSIFKYPLEALLINEYGGDQGTTFFGYMTGNQILDRLGLAGSSKWVEIACLFGFAVVYRALCYCALCWQKTKRS